MKPIETDDTPQLPYGKILFLIVIILIAVVVTSLPRKEMPVGAERTNTDTEQSPKTDKKDQRLSVDEQETHTQEEKTPDVNRERNYQDELVKEVQKSYDAVAQEAQKKTEDVTNDVLGVAQEKVEETASRSASTIKNTIYRSTIGQLILQLIDSMPEEAWEEMKPEVCAPKEELGVESSELGEEEDEEKTSPPTPSLPAGRQVLEKERGDTTDVGAGSEPAEDGDESSTSFEDYDACFREKIKDAEGPDDYQKAMEECKN